DVVVVEKRIYVQQYERRHGGPPPWAPAWGRRGNDHSHYQYAGSPFGLDSGRCDRDLLGSVLGGVAGGVVGSQFGQGDGNTA
ncbi:hypothetical protein, partial [Salmonella enterica]|uniref:hypothetical protein n=1 Tax=Salmonella enterica TaxID=28901 RepID=UPI0032970CC3